MKKKLVVLTGAGISAESGIKTFRDSDGLWEGHNVNDVATPEGWAENPELVLDFYNQRRRQLKEVQQNFEVSIITQNVDDLHERAGSRNVLHLHGELLKVRSTKNYNFQFDWTEDLILGDLDENDDQLRPHIVWFGEEVPALEKAMEITLNADILVIIGTSLQVYPAAGLMHYTKPEIPIFYIDPKPISIPNLNNPIDVIPETASVGMKILKKKLLASF